jgi:transposase-like protein
MKKTEKIDISCPNKECGSKERQIIRFGLQLNGHQRYRCLSCKRTFVDTIESPFFHKHLKREEIVKICKLLSEKNAFRAIARMTHHHLDTVRKVVDVIAGHYNGFDEYYTKELGLTPLETDEMVSFVKKKKKIA